MSQEVVERKGERRIEAVFFDVGGTLMHASPSVPEMFALVARDRGHALTLDDVMPHAAAADEFYEAEYRRDGDFWCSHERSVGIWKDMYRLLAHRTGIAWDAEGMADEVFDRYLRGDAWQVYEDVAPCLDGLRRAGVRLGVISNWDGGLPDLLHRVGLLPYFDEVVSSAAVGRRKPDAAIFEIALERMGVPASRAAHVGDLPEADGAAAGAGMRPVIVDRKGAQVDCGIARVPSLARLPELLAVDFSR